MTSTKRIILITGSRDVPDVRAAFDQAREWLEFELSLHPPKDILVIHGAAQGWDTVWNDVGLSLGVHVKACPAEDYADPLARNQAMVDLVVELGNKYPSFPTCWAFARTWASGTGHCARRARKAGIPTTDFGVPTGVESKKER